MNAPTTSSSTKSADRPNNGYSIFADALPEALARDDFTNLAVLLRYAREGCWAFAIYSHVAAREEVVAALKTLLQPLPTYEWTYSPERPSPLSYLDALTETQRQERAVVFFFDLERAPDELWKSLDYNREALSAQPHGLVFWISSAGRGRAMRAAPHFWSQRSGVFDFRLAPGPLPPLSDWAQRSDIVIDDWENILRQIRITQGLLDELLATPDAPQGVIASQHLRLGRLCYYVDRLPAARTHLEAAEALAPAVDDLRFSADVQKALGDLALREDDLAGARRRYEAALALYPQLGARLGEANVQKALGDLALREDDLAGARRRYEAALALYPQLGDRLGEANVLQALGDLALREADLAGARRRYEAALALYPQLGARLGEANVQKALGDLALREADLAGARRRYEAALALYPQLGARLGEANVLQALGDLALREDDLAGARRRYEAALALYPQLGARLGEANVQKALGDLALREADLAGARRRYEAALALYPQLGARLGEANVLQALGDLALREDDLAGARRRYEAALALYPQLGDRLGEANVQKALGDLALREADLAGARRRYEAALALYPQLGDRLGEANVLQALGDLALREADLAGARRRYEAALALYPQLGDRLGEANVLAALARVELLEGQAQRAMTFLTRALDFYQSINNRYNIAVVLYNFGFDLLRLDRREDAAPLLLQAADLFEEIGLPQYAVQARQMAGDAPTPAQQAARIEAAVTELRQRGDATLLSQALAVLLAQRMEMENWQGAVETAQELLTFDSADAQTWATLADAYSRLDEEEAAADAYAHAVAGDGDNAMLRRNFANTLVALKRLDEAAAQLAVAARLAPDAPYLALRYAELAKAHADRDEAKRWAIEALRRQPEWEEAQELLTWAAQG